MAPHNQCTHAGRALRQQETAIKCVHAGCTGAQCARAGCGVRSTCLVLSPLEVPALLSPSPLQRLPRDPLEELAAGSPAGFPPPPRSPRSRLERAPRECLVGSHRPCAQEAPLRRPPRQWRRCPLASAQPLHPQGRPMLHLPASHRSSPPFCCAPPQQTAASSPCALQAARPRCRPRRPWPVLTLHNQVSSCARTSSHTASMVRFLDVILCSARLTRLWSLTGGDKEERTPSSAKTAHSSNPPLLGSPFTRTPEALHTCTVLKSLSL